jgi:hypothetical protein
MVQIGEAINAYKSFGVKPRNVECQRNHDVTVKIVNALCSVWLRREKGS